MHILSIVGHFLSVGTGKFKFGYLKMHAFIYIGELIFTRFAKLQS